MFNAQIPIANTDHPYYLWVKNIWVSIQGEGPFAGRVATFIRLAGCNLACPLCDTDYTKDTRSMSVKKILEVVEEISKSRLIVLTGGEPFRQDIRCLVDSLLFEVYEVQIETNGTIYRDLAFGHRKLSIICSPKTPKINKRLRQHITAFKYVVQSGAVDERGLPKHTMGFSTPVWKPDKDDKRQIYLIPLDEGDQAANERNVKQAVESCLEHDYRLCLQQQKIIGVE